MFYSIKYFNRTKNEVIRDLTDNFGDHHPAEFGYGVAFGFRLDSTSLLDEKYLKLYELEVFQHISTHNGDGTFTNQKIPLELEKWGENFPFYNQTLVREYLIGNYVWIKNKNYAIGGNRYSKERKSLSVNLRKWNPAKRNDCKTDTEIDAHIKLREFELIMIDSYFDIKDFNNPIYTYLTQY